MPEYCVVNTEYGKVRGEKIVSKVEIPYIRFLGIPYAKPPVGELRFQNPIKPNAWEGVYDALEEPSPCAGKNNYIKKFVGSDDCLYLNVYTKNVDSAKKCATIVYIHGGGNVEDGMKEEERMAIDIFDFMIRNENILMGFDEMRMIRVFFGGRKNTGFMSGSSTLYSYSPDYILMSDVVFVIFNYRIGALGSANFHDKSLNIPGNVCMKDQQMAMRFVRDNIHEFGGDPDNITLMGHSSGASSVGLHCISESSKGLFHKAVMMSGSPLGEECIIRQLGWTKRLAKKLGFGGDLENDKEVLDFLNKADVLEMAEAGAQLVTQEEREKLSVMIPFGPHLELYETESTFLMDRPVNLLSKAWANDIDLMIGGTKNEGMSQEYEPYENSVPIELVDPREGPNLTELAEKFQKYYESKYDNKLEARNEFNADAFRWSVMIRAIKARLLSDGKGKTFLYQFCVDSPTQNHYRNRYFGAGSKGVVHADELSYFWKNELGDVPVKDSMEFQAIKKFTSIFTSFAINGNPNNTEIAEVDWKPVDTEPYKGLIIDQKLEFKEMKEARRVLEFWEKLYAEYGVKFC